MTQYVREFEITDKPDIHVLVIGPHDPPIDELTLGMGLAATAAQIQHFQTTDSTLPFYLPPWPH